MQKVTYLREFDGKIDAVCSNRCLDLTDLLRYVKAKNLNGINSLEDIFLENLIILFLII